MAENVSYVYDTVNALCPAGETFATGRLSKMTDQSGTTEYCYDRFGNLARKVQTTGGVVHTLRYGYTKSNQIATMTYPDNTVVDYVRDTQQRVREVGVTASGGTRQVAVKTANSLPAGPATSWQTGNNRTLTRNYDFGYRATNVRDPGPTTNVNDDGLDIRYVYDSASYLKQVLTHSTGTIRAKFDYDTLGRLLARKNATDVIQESYTYDKTGNRLTNTVGATTTHYTYPAGSHWLTQVGAVARTYDAAGNLSTVGGTAQDYVYNNANRMSVARANGVVQASYVYNGFGEQVQRQSSVTTRFVYDEGGNLIGQYNNTGAPIQQYVWMEGIPVAVLTGTGASQVLRYVQTDQLGTPRAVIDPTQNRAVWRWDESTEGFGNSAPNTDPDDNGTAFVFDLRFPGQRYDAASGLHYNYFRDYDPATGRYTQSDPIGLLGGINTYVYVKGSPLMKKDSLGLQSFSVDYFVFGTGGGIDIYFDYTRKKGFEFDGLGLRAGVGEGAGVSWDPTDERPGNDILCGEEDRKLNVSLGLYGQGSIGIPFAISANGEIHAGLRTNYAPWGYESKYPQWGSFPFTRPYADITLPSAAIGSTDGRQALAARYNYGIEVIIF